MNNVNDCVVAKFAECNSILVEAMSYLNDVNASAFTKSKTLLANEAVSKVKAAISVIDSIKHIVLKYTVPSEEARKIEVAHTLKEVGLRDMDDPTYSGIGSPPCQESDVFTKADLHKLGMTGTRLSDVANDLKETASKAKNRGKSKKAK